MIRIELVPAAFGDCLLIEYGNDAQMRRILIDAGLAKTYEESLLPRLKEIEGGKPVPLELLVVTHIDRDHICGILPLLREDPRMVKPKDIWFNGRHHLEPDTLGAKDGEALGALLIEQQLPWNLAFGADAAKAAVVPDKGDLPSFELAGGAVITLLSPYAHNLEQLAAEWDDTLGAWDQEPGAAVMSQEVDDVLGKRAPLRSISVADIREFSEATIKEDKARPNGSSIAFLFEYDDKRILFGADAFPSVVLRSLERFSDQVVELDAFKMSHHGSMNNLTDELLAKVKCRRYLVSTNGASFGHPHPEALARVICATRSQKALCFNYSCPYTTVWDDPTTTHELHYEALFPSSDAAGFVLEL